MDDREIRPIEAERGGIKDVLPPRSARTVGVISLSAVLGDSIPCISTVGRIEDRVKSFGKRYKHLERWSISERGNGLVETTVENDAA